ncbi:MAG: hypothetical protein ABI467_29450 [Kofleriaceae bacterium]
MVGLLTTLVAIVLATACGNLRVDPASPRPNVDLPAASAPGRVELAPAILDSFVIPKTGSVNQVPVTGWRGTLLRGFQSGFGTGSSGQVLVLREAELTFGPAAIGTGGTAAVRARIRFKSSLSDASGTEVGRISGEVSARDAATSPTPEAMTANAAQAVEAMYEQIAEKIAHPDK